MSFLPIYKYDQVQLHQFVSNFVNELRVSESFPTSLGFINNPIPDEPFIKEGEKFQALAYGGTNYSTGYFQNSLPIKMVSQTNGLVQNFQSLEEFTDFIVSISSPDFDKLVINFAYPLKPIIRDGRMDGILIRVAKENNLRDMIGLEVGESIERQMLNKYGRKIQVALANDIICLLHQPLQLNEFNLAAGIVGTGFNFGFYKDTTHIINLESGHFDKFEQSPTGKIVDEQSTYPHTQQWEKEVSGAYLYRHYNLIAAEQNWKLLDDTEAMNQIAAQDNDEGETARSLLARSANLVACQIAAIYKFMEVDSVIFVMEGSVFWHAFEYIENVRQGLKTLGIDPSTQISFLKPEPPLHGAIALGIRNEESIDQIFQIQ